MARFTCTTLGALLAFAHAAHAAQIVSSLPANATADYVIIGGGLGGMVLANRLSAGGTYSVIVLEAGPDARYVDEINDPFPYNAGLAGNGDYNWQYPTVSQSVGGTAKTISGGKVLGGSTSINGMDWTRGTVSQYDSIAALNNDSSYSWDEFFPYMKLAEHFYPPSNATKAKGAYYDPDAHGYQGNVGVSYVQPYRGWNLSMAYTAAARSVFGLSGGDVTGGDPNVAAQIALSVHPAGNFSMRSSSATSYLYPLFPPQSNTSANHRGLTVVPSVLATRILWTSSGAVATGVEYSAADGSGSRMTVHVNKEVLVCAGALGSPALLLRSGVGPAAELRALNITPVVNLPSIGKNLQDQALLIVLHNVTAEAAADPTRAMLPQIQGNLAFPSLAQLFSADAAANMSAALTSSARSRAAAIVQAGGHSSVAGLTKQFKQQANQLANGAPAAEVSTGIIGPYASALCWQLLPQYRGTVRLASADPFTYPLVDPQYLTTDFDMTVLTATARGGRAIFADPRVAVSMTNEILPGAAVPANASDAQWAGYITAAYNPVYHPIGTAAMMSQADGGAVDTAFKLYGVANVRVVDASVLPMQLSAHLSATLYGFAEKAAEAILDSN